MNLGEHTSDKLLRLRSFMQTQQLDAVWLRHHANVAWLSDGGRAHIYTACDAGVLSLVVTATHATVVTNRIEEQRLRHEEGLGAWDFAVTGWHEAAGVPQALQKAKRIGCDLHFADGIALGGGIVQLRAPLLAGERKRYAALGHDVSHALHEAVGALRPGVSEHGIAAAAAAAVHGVGAEPVVLLVAGDERLQHVRHPLPTAQAVQRHGMVVVCARRHGLVVSLTRLFAWGAQPELERKVAAVAAIDAQALDATRPGTSLASMWECIIAGYAHVGHPDAWQGLHQGGPCSYEPRDLFITPRCAGTVQLHQAFAWNPSIPGAKSEDTLLVGENGAQPLTLGPWPVQHVPLENGHRVARPAVLHI